MAITQEWYELNWTGPGGSAQQSSCCTVTYYPSRKPYTLDCRRRYCVLIFNFHFLVVYLICFYMWLRVLTSRKVAIYRDGDIIIIFIEFSGLGWLLHWLCLYYIGWVGITLVVLVWRWLRWYFVGSVGCYPFAKCWWKIKVVEKNEDVVRF